MPPSASPPSPSPHQPSTPPTPARLSTAAAVTAHRSYAAKAGCASYAASAAAVDASLAEPIYFDEYSIMANLKKTCRLNIFYFNKNALNASLPKYKIIPISVRTHCVHSLLQLNFTFSNLKLRYKKLNLIF
jgi:hypothetical protein